MAYNSRDLKVVSIVQLVMTAIFLILGLVDRFQVRYLYTSFLMSPCWTAAIVSRLWSYDSILCLPRLIQRARLLVATKTLRITAVSCS